ncbi:COR domain-containing protein [Micromonospora parva]|uniref:COR domain-containing protein n=1 Tax=Micromonospora parva TaxID=1464048 RepID=UPI00341117DF
MTKDRVVVVDDSDEDEDEDFGYGVEILSPEDLQQAIAAAAETGILNLAFASMQEIPDAVFELEQLRELRLSSNAIAVVPREIGRLKNLTVLELWDNEGCVLPFEIGELEKLEVLSIGSACPMLPPSIGKLKELRRLSIGDNGLRYVPSWLFRLEKLEALQLWSNELRTLPDKWDRLPHLKVVNLSKNKLVELPPSFGALRELEGLALDHNRLEDLPSSMANLPITNVRLGFNRFVSVPDVVGSWSSLRVLNFFNIKSLDVYFQNEVDDDRDDLDPAVSSASHIRCYSNDEDEDDAQALDLVSLESLLPALEGLPNLEILLLQGHPSLQLPVEVLGPITDEGWVGSAKSILDYYFRTRESGRPLNEAKLILLGWGGVGKTSLVNRLVHGHFKPDEPRTEGIQVTSWNVTLPDQYSARLNVWDFGGQEIMHATHQFFLTSRSLYVLVLSGRSGSADADAEYWLRLMESFASGSPVIVALNQISKDPFELDEVGLRQRFPDIRAFVRTDCAVGDEGLGIENLKAQIVQETSALPDLRVKFPAAWFEIKNRLSAMRENYLSFETFRGLCRQHGEGSRAEQEKLAEYLHLLGIALNYRDDPRLRDTHVLNPHWVTEGIYAILNSPHAAQKKGEIEPEDLDRILDSGPYPPERHAFLLDLMRKFELCFPYHDHPDRFLVAELLPKQQPVDVERYVDALEVLQFQYRYPALPEGLMPRFIVRSHALSAGQPRWRGGCVLMWEGNRALVKAEPTEKVIHITVDGPPSGRRRLLAVIRSDFEHIHQSFKFKVDAYVPYRPRRRQLMVNYDKLVAAERAGMVAVQEFMDGEFYNVPVAELLHGVDLAKPNRGVASTNSAKLRSKSARLFLSYSHKDEAHKDALENHLKVLRRSGLIDVWSDRRIGAGDGWRGSIDRNLQDADLVILLVSSDFLASDYCTDKEMGEALRRRAAGECDVIPVIVRDCNWLHEAGLKELQALPTDGKAVTRWDNVDTAWRIVSQGIEDAVRRK